MSRKSKKTGPARSPFVDHVVDSLSGLGDVRSRAMFGGHGVYCDNVMIGLIADGMLYFKVDDGNRERFEAAGSQPFQYRRRGRRHPVRMSYWEVPAEALDNPDSLCQWGRTAQEAALRCRAART